MTDSAFRPRRSALFMPGANARAMEKARTLPADVVILDLEDAVAPDAKAEARDRIAAAVRAGGYGAREIVVRVNGLETEWAAEDLAMVAQVRPDAVLVPKVSSADDIARAAPGGLPVWAMIETPRAILDIGAIAAAPGLAAFVMGTNDLGKDMRARMTPGREAFHAALSLTVTAARAHGLIAIDGVFNDIADEAGLAAECEQGRTLGFEGKSAIHPAQLDACNRIFAPAEEEVAAARAIIAAFALPENVGAGVLKVEGKMAERLHLEEAERLVATAEAIAARAAG